LQLDAVDQEVTSQPAFNAHIVRKDLSSFGLVFVSSQYIPVNLVIGVIQYGESTKLIAAKIEHAGSTTACQPIK
jgi:hypothetical protein